jgi:hypothetical protein
VVKLQLQDLARPTINQSIVPEKPRETCNQPKKYRALHNLCIALILLGILVTSALLIYLVRPWEDPFFPGTASEYWGLFCLLLWVMGPYFLLLITARRSHPVGPVMLLRLIGATIICAGGVVLYLDAWWRTPKPLMALVFFAVPHYQWVVVVPLMVVDYFLRRRTRGESPEG